MTPESWDTGPEPVAARLTAAQHPATVWAREVCCDHPALTEADARLRLLIVGVTSTRPHRDGIAGRTPGGTLVSCPIATRRAP